MIPGDAPRIASACECCGAWEGQPVPVKSRATGRRLEVWLCSRCLQSDQRAWRLRWTLVERAA
jgi:hypothetical protein